MEAMMLDALFALAWICMLRIEEALSIEIADVRINQAVMVNGVTYEYHLLTVSNRKNNKGTYSHLL
jgi:integrase